jgi:hypothetical protein
MDLTFLPRSAPFPNSKPSRDREGVDQLSWHRCDLTAPLPHGRGSVLNRSRGEDRGLYLKILHFQAYVDKQ